MLNYDRNNTWWGAEVVVGWHAMWCTLLCIFEYAPFQLKEDDAKIIIMPMDDPNSLLHHALQTFDLVNIKKETIHQQH